LTDLDLLHFEQLKSEVQATYLQEHTASHDDISKWKGIDIVYFQEDLRKRAKGSLSEKSFYTYFKNSPVTKLPRIDTLNLLSLYVGYDSWYDFKKNHLFANEILAESEEVPDEPESVPAETEEETVVAQPTNSPVTSEESAVEEELPAANAANGTTENKTRTGLAALMRKTIWFGVSIVLLAVILVLTFQNQIFSRQYKYCFTDGDRGTAINNPLEVKILKDGESPMLYRVEAGKCFVYNTKEKNIRMVINSPFYKPDTIYRNLDNAPDTETIELKPDDYAIMLFYYSKSIKDLKKKREQLDRLINDNALIYQVFDNEYYGVETLSKQKYISLVTLPSTSLENLEVIETQMSNGQIKMIKFRIKDHEQTQ